ncbi:MAG: hypothetical protein Q9181_007326, partial [Wetmoreana brouardii]
MPPASHRSTLHTSGISSNEAYGDPMELDEPREDRPQAAMDARQTGAPDDRHLKKGARQGPLPADSRIKARTVRAIGACWRCKIFKITVLKITDHKIPIKDFDHADTEVLHSELRKLKFNSLIVSTSYLPVHTLIDNAVRIDSVAAKTVHRALHALLASTQMLHDLLQRYPGAAGSHQLDLADVDNRLLSDFRSHLDVTFCNFEHSLFKAADGTGPAICVSIFILFIITMVLQEMAQHFKLPILTETAVDDVLRALFGLLSITYRNIGILDILQEFSDRELNPNFGEPSLDIIEALQDLLSMRASLPKRTADRSTPNADQILHSGPKLDP